MVDKFLIPGDHPSLQGHFPGNPVVPGVVILNEVVSLIEKKFTNRLVMGIKFIKFVRPLRPDSEVVLHVEENAVDTLNITCEDGDNVLVKGQLILSGKDVA